jgi:hypothetical protein
MKIKELSNKIRAGITASDPKVQQIIAGVKAGLAVKGMGKTILEKIGKELNQSGGLYKNCKNPDDAASIFMSQFERIFGKDIKSGLHNLTYKSDDSLLISIDGEIYEINGTDLKASILKMAKNAGIPAIFSGIQLAKLLIEGLIAFWQKCDPAYSGKNRLLKE